MNQGTEYKERKMQIRNEVTKCFLALGINIQLIDQVIQFLNGCFGYLIDRSQNIFVRIKWQ